MSLLFLCPFSCWHKLPLCPSVSFSGSLSSPVTVFSSVGYSACAKVMRGCRGVGRDPSMCILLSSNVCVLLWNWFYNPPTNTQTNKQTAGTSYPYVVYEVKNVWSNTRHINRDFLNDFSPKGDSQKNVTFIMNLLCTCFVCAEKKKEKKVACLL